MDEATKERLVEETKPQQEALQRTVLEAVRAFEQETGLTMAAILYSGPGEGRDADVRLMALDTP